MKIVTTIDFSITSETLLKYTKMYSDAFHAEVSLVHAEPSAVEEGEPTDLTSESIVLKKDALALERAGVNVRPVFLKGPVCESILNHALEINADLIIIGAHGHGGPNCKAPVGHISQCVLIQSKIPVLIIPA